MSCISSEQECAWVALSSRWSFSLGAVGQAEVAPLGRAIATIGAMRSIGCCGDSADSPTESAGKLYRMGRVSQSISCRGRHDAPRIRLGRGTARMGEGPPLHGG